MSTPPTAAAAPSVKLRRPPPDAARAPRTAQPDPSVKITGRLLEDAHTRVEPGTGRAAYSVVVGQGAGRPDIIATCWTGDGPDGAAHAAARAAELRAGDTVAIRGAGLAMRYSHHALAIAVIATGDVELVATRAEAAA